MQIFPRRRLTTLPLALAGRERIRWNSSHRRHLEVTTWTNDPVAAGPSDVLGTGWFATVAAEAGPGKTAAGSRR